MVNRAWQDWGSERAKWFAIAVRTVLVMPRLVCLFAFLVTGIKSQWKSSGHRQFTYNAGASEPWFILEA